MRGRDNTELVGGILALFFYIGIAGIVIYIWFPGFGSDILNWLERLLPTGTGIAQVTWRVLGTLMAAAVLTAFFFKTGIDGHWHQRSAGVHGVIGIVTGFTVLVFTAAYLYGQGLKIWVSLLGGIGVSVLLKLLFAYWRARLVGRTNGAPGVTRIIYRRVER